jgi:hypothetical protein
VTEIERVCRIARDLRRPGAESLRALIEASSYRAVRPSLDIARLEGIVDSDPRLVDDWLRYSEDKRTSGGWAFYADDENGWVVKQPFPDEGAVDRRHSKAATACADYILTELDHSSDVDDRRRHG